MISIDIVPCIHTDGWWPSGNLRSFKNLAQATADELTKYGCSLGFAQSSSVYHAARYRYSSAQVSFSYVDSRLIRNRPPVVRAAYMVGKLLVSNSPSRYAREYLPRSHVLKTAVLECLSETDVLPPTGRVDDAYLRCKDVDAEELCELVRKLFHRCLSFAYQDFVPAFLMPSFRLPVWQFERDLYFCHRVLQRHGVDYLTLTSASQTDVRWKTHAIECSFAISHLLYWSVLEEGAHIRAIFPNILEVRYA